MTKTQLNSNPTKSIPQVVFEYILLVVCLCVIALRTTFTETPNTQSVNQLINFSDPLHSLSISAVLILAFVLWFVLAFFRKKIYYCFTFMEIGLSLFFAAAVLASFAAPDKRAAITNVVTLVAPVLMAILLVQILDSDWKVKLVLCVVVALGVVSAYQCAEQFFLSNQVMIDQYEKTPQTFLKSLGIQQGTFAHMLFEHRLYSKGGRGFFTTGNSTGSFAILACFAGVALLVEKIKNLKNNTLSYLQLLMCAVAVGAILFGLVITRSKGAISALLIAAVIFFVYLLFANWLKAHKKAILVSIFLLVLIAGCLIICYGISYGRLAGGPSMLVRWQYWSASARMYADHPLTGVGGGNFVSFYPHYKNPAALETVADPHNFLLSLLTQYGPVGLVAFLAMILLPLSRPVFRKLDLPAPEPAQPQPVFKVSALLLLIAISASLLFIRPILAPMPPCASAEEKTAAAIMLYIMPAAVFIIVFLLLTAAVYSAGNTQARSINIAIAALFCAIAGCLIHNLIDFAIFEPGVLTTFWVVIAVLIAKCSLQNHNPEFALKPAVFARIAVMIVGLIIIWAYFQYCLIPVAKSTTKIKQAYQANRNGQFQKAYSLAAAAVKQDQLSPVVASLAGRLYLQNFYHSSSKNPDLLLRCQEYLLNAIKRNNANFKNFELLSDVYILLAEFSQDHTKTDWLNMAFESSLMAVERYPGSARLRMNLARITEQLGKNDLALKQYKKAIEIEDSFRLQFKIVYPDREVVSRLGQEKYDFAKQRIKLLCP